MKSDNFIVIQGWMMNELELKGNELLVYALIYGFSQDGESMFAGSRHYIANTLNISLPTVDKALNSLVDKQYLKKITAITGGIYYKADPDPVKKLCLPGKETLPPPVKKLCLPGKETLYNKDNSNIQEKNNKKTTPNFEFGKKSTASQNLYKSCQCSINEFTSDVQLRSLLQEFLKTLSSMQMLRSYRQFQGTLNKLSGYTVQEQIQMVTLALDRGWASFYPVQDSSYYKKKAASDMARVSVQYCEEDKRALKEAIANGNGEKF